MNQILYTGGKGKKRGTLDTKKIIIFFVVLIVIFAIAIISIGINLLSKVKKEPSLGENNTTGNQVETPIIKPEIKIGFDSELGAVKIKITSNTNLQNMSYWWDEEEATEVEISGMEYEQVVPTKQGTHTLYVKVISETGYQVEENQLVIGDSGPEVTILTDGVSNYVIRVKDDQEVKKVEIILNGVTQEIEVNSKEHELKIPIPTGDSLIEVTAYNLNNLTATKKAKITNFGG